MSRLKEEEEELLYCASGSDPIALGQHIDGIDD
jgi:hypothetical protein